MNAPQTPPVPHAKTACGLTKREWFAGQAITTAVAGFGLPSLTAKQAFLVADAMIAESERGTPLALANAQLARIAPDLLEAVKALLAEAKERGGGLSNGEKLGCAAIAKATANQEDGK